MSKSPSLRRIQADIRELTLDPSDRYHAAPLENDMFEWHFTIRGAEGTDFEGGIYHGRILLPPEYPFKPPHIIFLTPSGRFETNTKVCLSFSAYHPELWQPAWGIRLILEALISFLPTPADGAIGSLDWSSEERKRLAKLSQSYTCAICGKCSDLLPKIKDSQDNKNDDDDDDDDNNKKTTKRETRSRFAKEIEELQRLQQFAERKPKTDETSPSQETNEESTEDTVLDESSPPMTEPTMTTTTAVATTTAISTTTSTATATIKTEEKEEQETDNPKESNQVADIPTATDTTTTTTTTTPDITPAVEEIPILDMEPPIEDPSWMYDPLLNLMMVLLAVICYLLIQKYQELMEELDELRVLSDIGRN